MPILDEYRPIAPVILQLDITREIKVESDGDACWVDDWDDDWKE